MSYGLMILGADGASRLVSNAGWTLLDAISLSSSSGNGAKAYPDAGGLTIYFLRCFDGPTLGWPHSLTVDYSAGYPIVRWATASQLIGSHNFIFAR